MAAIAVDTDPQSTSENDQKLPIIDIARFSGLQKLINTMTWVWKNVIKLSRQIHEHNAARKEALNFLVRQVKKSATSDDIQSLKNTNLVAKVSKISQLSPFIDEKGILNGGGRLASSE